ncbi:MAG: FAD-linked oxidase C-terminal domain-containing protein [Planctomycetota bacterium]
MGSQPTGSLSKSARRALAAIVGERGVRADALARSAYESDGFALAAESPEVIVLPRSTEEAARVVRVLREEGLVVVPRGAGTGLTGGARPTRGGATVGTARMRDVLEVSELDRFARVQAGVVNVHLTAAAEPCGLFYAPDPSSQTACTIGGNVANNSGGPHCFKYGTTARHVLGVTLVDSDGEVHELGGPDQVDPDAGALDLVGPLVGSEGMLGLVTEVTVALLPEPETVETLLVLYESLDACCDAVSAMIAENLEPSAIEILDRLTIEAVEASVLRAGYPANAEAVALIEVEGGAAEVDAIAADVETVARKHGAFDVERTRDGAERKRLWAGRKGAFGAMGRIAPDLYVADVVAPRTKLRDIVAVATRACAARGLKLSNVLHAGDGNLHPNISYDRRDPDEVERVVAAATEIMRACVDAGGSLTGEHGVGLEKQAEMCLVFGDDDLDAMKDLRRAFDPTGFWNPGKLFPVRACREVAHAPLPVQLPHPGGTENGR